MAHALALLALVLTVPVLTVATGLVLAAGVVLPAFVITVVLCRLWSW